MSMGRADVETRGQAIRGHPWRQLVVAALLLGLSMAIGLAILPPDPDVDIVAAIGAAPDVRTHLLKEISVRHDAP